MARSGTLSQRVSTHSRPKAAGWTTKPPPSARPSFNTQPPEGGWAAAAWTCVNNCSFNTQPPEGGWKAFPVQTRRVVCFNTQPPEGGWSGA